jgi:hypothetical protein
MHELHTHTIQKQAHVRIYFSPTGHYFTAITIYRATFLQCSECITTFAQMERLLHMQDHRTLRNISAK